MVQPADQASGLDAPTAVAGAATVPVFDARDTHWMQQALLQARAAALAGEVPVGALLLAPDGALLAQAGNAPVSTHDPTAHAEIRALRAAGAALGNYRLSGCTLYVTLEPCPMCMAAIAMARVGRLVFGAADERLGACGGALDLSSHAGLNPHTMVQGGLLADECAGVLREFFHSRRPPKSERLQRIARLEDVPNIDPPLASWLRARGLCEPSDLSVMLQPGIVEGWLAASIEHSGTNGIETTGGAETSDGAETTEVATVGGNQDRVASERRARLRAVHHFVAGGAALPWRQFLQTEC